MASVVVPEVPTGVVGFSVTGFCVLGVDGVLGVVVLGVVSGLGFQGSNGVFIVVVLGVTGWGIQGIHGATVAMVVGVSLLASSI